MTSTLAPTIRDVSHITLPDIAFWDYSEFDECQFCGRLTPKLCVNLGGKKKPFIPYPCDCEGYQAHLDEYEQWAHPEKESTKPARYQAIDVDVSGYIEGINNGRGVYLFGLQGVGKTTIAYEIADVMRLGDWRVEVVKVASLLASLYGSIGEQDATIASLVNCDLLILDDLGAENVSEYSVSLVLSLLDRRCEAMKPVVVTSNYSLGKLGERYAKTNKVSAASIVSRLSQMCEAVEITGQDRRKQ